MMEKIIKSARKIPLPLALRRLAFRHKYRKEAYGRYWSDLKNKYQGRRGFVIANGPSLLSTDLDRLKNEVCIASNKIYLIFEKTEWRPTFHTIVDPEVWKYFQYHFSDSIEVTHIASYLSIQNKAIRNRVKVWLSLSNKKGGIGFSEDFIFGAYGGHTVTYENLQFARHLGLDPIYLIGYSTGACQAIGKAYIFW